MKLKIKLLFHALFLLSVYQLSAQLDYNLGAQEKGETKVIVLNNSKEAKLITPPLPLQPAPKAIQTASAPVNQVTGLTTSETALLSPDEQAIRLRQRGRA